MIYRLKTYPSQGKERPKFIINRVGNNTEYIACDEDGQEMVVSLQWVKDNQPKIVNVGINRKERRGKLFYTDDRYEKACQTISQSMYNKLVYGEGIRPFWESAHMEYTLDAKGNLQPEERIKWAWGELIKEGQDTKAHYIYFMRQAIERLWGLNYNVFTFKTGKQRRSIWIKIMTIEEVNRYIAYKPQLVTPAVLQQIIGSM